MVEMEESSSTVLYCGSVGRWSVSVVDDDDGAMSQSRVADMHGDGIAAPRIV